MSTNAVADNFLAYAAAQLEHLQTTIARCLARLTDEQVLQRGGDYENSVANLLLHLEGNLRQWVLHGIGEQPDVRRRDEEFALDLSVSSAEARQRFNLTLHEAVGIIAALPPECLLAVIDPQPGSTWRHTTVLEAIFRVVGHVEMHAGQIILLTKQRTASDLDLSIPRKRSLPSADATPGPV